MKKDKNSSIETSRRQLLGGGSRLVAAAGLLTFLGACGRKDSEELRSSDWSKKFASYRTYDAMGLAELVRDGEVSPRELLDIAIERINQVDPQLNFMAVDMYEQAAAELEKGLPQGPFTGVPFLLKDLSIHLKDEVMTQGSRLFRNQRSSYTSTLAQRYRDAGLIIFGRTTSPEFGSTVTTESTLHGPSRNPWNTRLSTGGSSGGAAAAVAAGVIPCANASDGGGSIRIPASCCGLFGLKPSRGRVPYGPVSLEGADGLSAMHVVSRSVRDSAAMLDATRGPEPGSPYVAVPPERPYLEELERKPPKMRIAVLRENAFDFPLHSDCEKGLEKTVSLCRELGHEMVEISWPAGVTGREAGEAMGVLMGINTLIGVENFQLQNKLRRFPLSRLEPINAKRLAAIRDLKATHYLRARKKLWQLSALAANHFAGYDLVLSPVMAAPPPPLDYVSLKSSDFEEFSVNVLPYASYTAIYNVTGQPAMSVPLHWNDENVPIGMMFAAPINREDLLFRMAAQLEHARPWFSKLPQI